MVAAPIDLLVIGQITRDLLYTPSICAERIGGVSYAASAAARLGLRVGLLAGVSEASEEAVRNELHLRRVDTQGLQAYPYPPLTYKIFGADELLDQHTRRMGPEPWELAPPKIVPPAYEASKMALIYPTWMPDAVAIARQLKVQGTRLATDLQHDVESLPDAVDLLRLCDYVFLNTASLLRLTEAKTIEAAIDMLRDEIGTDVIFVIKMGLGGSLVWAPVAGKVIKIPAFLSDFQLTVGAGDAYDAAFLASVLQIRPSAAEGWQEAGVHAAQVAAAVIESAEYDPSDILLKRPLNGRQPVFLAPEQAEQIQVYIAGHFQSAPLRLLIEEIAEVVEHLGMRTFLPHRDVGVVGKDGLTPYQAYQADVEGLRQSQAVVAVLDGASCGGTFFEMGLAAERGMPIIAICTDGTLPLSNMVIGACSDIVGDVKGILNPLMLHLAPFEAAA